MNRGLTINLKKQLWFHFRNPYQHKIDCPLKMFALEILVANTCHSNLLRGNLHLLWAENKGMVIEKPNKAHSPTRL